MMDFIGCITLGIGVVQTRVLQLAGIGSISVEGG